MRNTIEILFDPRPDSAAGLAWAKVAVSAAQGGYDTYVDPESIQGEGDVVRMWHLHDFKTAQSVEGKTYSSSKNHAEYDCSNRRRRILYFSWSTGNMGAGDVVHLVDSPSEWKPILPGSVAELLYQRACSNS